MRRLLIPLLIASIGGLLVADTGSPAGAEAPQPVQVVTTVYGDVHG
ncbi:MAG: hypothetical protein K1X38_16575 [Microthrixaceae bacterium]|nr:hypothetical protein [Microthrixaceae bacterium]